MVMNGGVDGGRWGFVWLLIIKTIVVVSCGGGRDWW